MLFRSIEDIKKYIRRIFSLFSDIAINEETEYYSGFIKAADKLKEIRRYTILEDKTIIGIGGHFSAGKSKFIKSIAGIGDLLPEATTPSTSIPTYIIKGKSDKYTGTNIFGIHYNKSGSFKDSLIRISNLKSMIQKKKEEETKSTTYSSSSNYSSTKSNYHSSSGCFITTAAVKNICATDDCAELEIMRNFRDSFINKTDIGQSLTLEYYRVAPIIVQHIDNDPDCDKIYQNIWQNYITQSLICIKNGEKKRAQIIYINMVQMLAEKYGVEVKEDIVKKYLCSIADE